MDTVVHGRSCAGPVPAGTCHQCGGPARRGDRVCSTACRRAWSDHHVWRSARFVALARAGYACEECGALDWDTVLDVHHRRPVDPVVGYRPGCQHHPENLQVLCRVHHLAAHRADRAQPGDQLSFVMVAA